ncbi:MAG TPA: DNA glycosylase [Candidatus Thermoplasmatota archaeon]|nr:DNA glycosylase [Candidatus Thermoplasmatota archaeon]
MRLRGPIDLPHSLLGGQAFRWSQAEDGAFRGVVGDALVEMRPRADGSVEAEGASRAALASYFRIERADAARRARLARDPALADAMRALPGLRLLRQDPWETTVAFLTSANNNVLRIEGTMRALAARWGDPLGEGHAAFPPPGRLARAREADLRACGLGYRAPFLRDTARLVARGEVDLASLRGASHKEAREALLALPGVGPKVADCIALFSLDVDDAFPIDRWVLRAMAGAFGPMDAKRTAAFAAARWGRDAGLAQQYLFHALRLRERAPGTRRVALA